MAKAKQGYKIVKSLYGKFDKIPIRWELNQIKDLVKSDKKVTYGIVQPGKFVKNGILLIYTPNANSVAFDYMLEVQNNVTPPIHLHYFNEKSINKLAGPYFLPIYFRTFGLDVGDIYAHERDNGNKEFSNFLYKNYQVLQTFFDNMDYGNHLRAIFKKK